MEHESEYITRKTRIDRLLGNSGWDIIHHKDVSDINSLSHHAVEELPTANGPADYALIINGKIFGIVEGKKVSIAPQNVLEQAKRYSEGADNTLGSWNGYKSPFLYSTNGELIYFLDIRCKNNLSRQTWGFNTPEGLIELIERDVEKNLEWFKTNPVDNKILRPYQKDAIAAIEDSLAAGNRNMLVAMATGTGKTFTMVNQVYRALESKFAKRVLFLVDRRSLAAQAVSAFASFETTRGLKFNQVYEVYSQRFRREDFEDDKFDPKTLPYAYLTNPDSTKTFLYVSTIQRMAINLYGREAAFDSNIESDDDSDAERIKIPNHAFDIIIADECHRGYTSRETNIWRSVLNHFDAVKIGLTATPASHTVSYFGKPVFNYNLQQAIEEGFLVDYDAVKINSNVLMKGAFLKEGELVGEIDTDTGKEIIDNLEDEREFKTTEIEESITSPDTNNKIIKEIAKYALDFEKEFERFPKILIFASNDIQHISHADRLVEICKKTFNRGDDFVAKITGNPNVDRPLKKIREFRNRPNPKIVVTVDMLSTGVDIPQIEFIVFLRPVKSRILWEQMLGRGTRRCDDIGKSHFVVFDCFNGTLIEYFRNASNNFKFDPPGQDIVTIREIIEKIYNNEDRAYNVKRLVKRLRRIEKDMSGKARTEFSKFIPDGDIGKLSDNISKFFKINK